MHAATQYKMRSASIAGSPAGPLRLRRSPLAATPQRGCPSLTSTSRAPLLSGTGLQQWGRRSYPFLQRVPAEGDGAGAAPAPAAAPAAALSEEQRESVAAREEEDRFHSAFAKAYTMSQLYVKGDRLPATRQLIRTVTL